MDFPHRKRHSSAWRAISYAESADALWSLEAGADLAPAPADANLQQCMHTSVAFRPPVAQGLQCGGRALDRHVERLDQCRHSGIEHHFDSCISSKPLLHGGWCASYHTASAGGYNAVGKDART